MIKYGQGAPTDVPKKYNWYIDLDTDILYTRVDDTWVAEEPIDPYYPPAWWGR